jgi:hypothetical protein
MLFLPEAAGPHDPVAATPARRPGSIRRTSSIDTARPGGLRGDAVVDARARDLRTDPDGTGHLVAEATLRVRLDAGRRVLAIEADPPLPALERLVGSSAGSGFRARVDDVVPSERDAGSLVYLLLDDLPGASLVSGYAVQRAGGFELEQPPGPGSGRALADLVRDDVCAGWAHDATIMVTIREQGRIPVPVGPPAPRLEPVADPLSWHALAALPAHGMRRRRRLDLVAPPPGERHFAVDAHFRDSYVGEDGGESVLHEYTVAGTVDPAAGLVVEASARAQVLPWTECPGAVASAGRLAGRTLASLRPWVRQELVGRSTCTHLNDTLRSLADVPALFDELARSAS